MRLSLAGFGLIWAGILLARSVGAAAHGGWTAQPVILLVLAWGAFFTTRMYRLAVIPSQGALVVRNLFRTRTVPKGEIDGFRLGSPMLMMPLGRTIHVLLSDDTILTVDVFLYSLGPGTSQRVEEQVQQLRRWLLDA
jgi:hypothetical protein